jgi:hypothetical protein
VRRGIGARYRGDSFEYNLASDGQGHVHLTTEMDRTRLGGDATARE